MNKENDLAAVVELFGNPTDQKADWPTVVSGQKCPFTSQKCFKIRKSDPSTSIGTCVVRFGKEKTPLIICPKRFLSNNRQVFTDCLHLLTCHEPGNELHIVSEVSIPGGNVDYFLISAKKGKPVDFVGIEFQGLDTTGTIWPHRQDFLKKMGVVKDAEDKKGFGVNWKMTAKTTLVQLHHKIETFEAINRKFVLILQQELLEYMTKEFSFGHLQNARLGDSMHFHPYRLEETPTGHVLSLDTRLSTDQAGITKALNLGQSGNVALEDILKLLASKMNKDTLWGPLA